MAKPKSVLISVYDNGARLMKAIINAVLDAGGTDEHLFALIGDPVKLAAIAAIIVQGVEIPAPEVKAPVPPQPKLRMEAESRIVHVASYALPAMLALVADFGKGNVSPIFDGQDWRDWQRDPSCVGIDETPGDREMRLGELMVNMTTPQIINEVPEGWRVALPAEGVAYAKKYPDEQKKFWILILGASALYGGRDRGVPVLGSDDRDRYLRSNCAGYTWGAGDRVLLVRKSG